MLATSIPDYVLECGNGCLSANSRLLPQVAKFRLSGSFKKLHINGKGGRGPALSATRTGRPRGVQDPRTRTKYNLEPGRKDSHLMSLQEVLPEQLAELFHHYHQALAPDFARDTKANPESWEQVPSQEKNRMIAAARLALLELGAREQQREDSRRYFAKPGEAEWGC